MSNLLGICNIPGVFDKLERDYGRIDIVCNNAGIQSFDYDVEDSQRAFKINLVSS